MGWQRCREGSRKNRGPAATMGHEVGNNMRYMFLRPTRRPLEIIP
jgi:hypothetical protein